MKRPLGLIVSLCLLRTIADAQTDSLMSKSTPEIFTRITKGLENYKPDTIAAPNDAITRKIIELRTLRGGFNINEVIDFKIEEDRQKNEVPESELDKIAVFFKLGKGKRWLDNAMIWIYRKQFTYGELKKIVKFYKTTAGQKMAKDFPIVMMQSLKAAAIIKDIYEQQQKSNK